MNVVHRTAPLLRRRATVTVIAIGMLLATVFASAALAGRGAQSSRTADPQITALQKQVKLLQAQVKALKKDNRDQWRVIGYSFDSQNCLGAMTADLVQGTWGVIDQIGQAQPTPTTYFGPQSQVPDYGTCGNFINPKVPRPGIQIPPTVDPLLPLLKWISS